MRPLYLDLIPKARIELVPRLRTESGARRALKSLVSSAISDTDLRTLHAVLNVDICHHHTDSLESLGALWMQKSIQLSENYED